MKYYAKGVIAIKHLGDITKIHGYDIPPVDVITGGSPCQDLSVAGRRAGLAGERSGLFMEQIRIIKEMREHDRNTGRSGWLIRPRYMVWENVSGALSSGTPKGEDFRIVLEETTRVVEEDAVIPEPPKEGWHQSGCILGDGWSIAWRVHDAQFWGVPQRRKRLALVADFGGLSAPEILFERKGMRGDPEESGEEGKIAAERTTGSAGVAETLDANYYKGQGNRGGQERQVVTESYTLKIRGGREIDSLGNRAGKGPLVQKELSATLGVSQDQTLFEAIPLEGNGSRDSHRGNGYGNEGDPSFTLNSVEQHAVAYGISPYASNAMLSDNPHSGIYKADTSRTLDLNGGTPACNQGGIAIVTNGKEDNEESRCGHSGTSSE